MKKTFRALSRRSFALFLALALCLSFLPAVSLLAETTNLLTNGDFENGMNGWTVNVSDADETVWGEYEVKNDEYAANNMTNFLHTANYKKSGSLDLTATQSLSLSAGDYTASIQAAGANEGSESSSLFLSAVSGDVTLASEAITMGGWDQWTTTTIAFTVEDDAEVTIGVTGMLADSSYCDLDNASLTSGERESAEMQELTLSNGDFESGDAAGWTLSGFSHVSASDSSGGSHALNLWLSDEAESEGAASYTVSLTAGTYQFGFELSGNASGSLGYSVSAGDSILDSGSGMFEDSEWGVWNSYTTNTFTLTEETEVTFTLSGTILAGAWGYLDNLTLKGTGALASAEPDTSVEADINVTKVQGLSDDFIMGMDISSVVSEFNSGVTYQDFDGNIIDNVSDFCQFLAECGVTHVRVRVWNDPEDASGNSYGGGANDIAAAVQIAEGCADAGLKMLVDFHCSDFWTDPGKQQAPKEWTDYSVERKSEALQTFLNDSLEQIRATGAEIAMVQIGNETNNGFIGETDHADMCTLFQAGSSAVRAFNSEHDTDIKVVIHVTNPESSNMTRWAGILDGNGVDYDILATSYYPSWHGTLSNLKSQLETVKSEYGKEVMVAETSYPFTLDETDGHENTVREGNNDTMMTDIQYPFSAQGQASYLRDLIDTVNQAGGIGVYYWESAWITVGDTTGLTGEAYDEQVAENKELWETYGSGWASSFASEYDPDDAGKWYGGSAVDNQAMFYADGSPVRSINVWKLVKTGAYTNSVSVDGIGSPVETIEVNGSYTLPETVTVTYNNGLAEEPVTWNEEDISAIDTSIPGTYTVSGTVTFSNTIDFDEYAGQTSAPVVFTLVVKYPNLIDADTASFEITDVSDFTIEGNGINLPASDDPKEGSKSLHWYDESGGTASVTYQGENSSGITLEPGSYTFECSAQGCADDMVTLRILSYGADGSVLAEGEPVTLNGWNDWKAPSVTLNITQETMVVLQMEIKITAGGWGTMDCMYLYRSGDYSEPEEPEVAEPEFEWSDDYTSCTAVFSSVDGETLARIECEVTASVTDPTCTEDGQKTYTATASYNGAAYTDERTETIKASGHHYRFGKCTVCGERQHAGDELGQIIINWVDRIVQKIKDLFFWFL